jgi:hypothetical protein
MNWTKQPLTQGLARSLRAATRRHPHIDGHTFGFSDLKELWVADDVHVICTHDHDPVWQYWYQHPEKGWMPISIHDTRQQAQQAAAGNVAPGPTGPTPGTYVCAQLGQGRWMRVLVQSRDGKELLTGIFTRLGANTKIETVKGAA